MVIENELYMDSIWNDLTGLEKIKPTSNLFKFTEKVSTLNKALFRKNEHRVINCLSAFFVLSGHDYCQSFVHKLGLSYNRESKDDLLDAIDKITANLDELLTYLDGLATQDRTRLIYDFGQFIESILPAKFDLLNYTSQMKHKESLRYSYFLTCIDSYLKTSYLAKHAETNQLNPNNLFLLGSSLERTRRFSSLEDGIIELSIRAHQSKSRRSGHDKVKEKQSAFLREALDYSDAAWEKGDERLHPDMANNVCNKLNLVEKYKVFYPDEYKETARISTSTYLSKAKILKESALNVTQREELKTEIKEAVKNKIIEVLKKELKPVAAKYGKIKGVSLKDQERIANHALQSPISLVAGII